MRFPVENFAAIRKISDFLFVLNFCRQPIAKLKQITIYRNEIKEKAQYNVLCKILWKILLTPTPML